MPSYNFNRDEQPSPVRASRQPFTFPNHHHLLITSSKHVLSWNREGMHELFTSGSRGILAAKESRDGGGQIAVADSQVVVLYDISHGSNKSYRLKGSDGQVRLLDYSDDSKCLFFTTTLHNAVQTYSIPNASLLDPLHMHPAPPTVLALSKTSHLLITACENVPTTYIQNLTHRTSPVLLKPQASGTAVVKASFHPDRPNVFLLAFKDGTLAAYDAVKAMRKGNTIKGPLRAGNKTHSGEIGHFRKLHAVTSRMLEKSQPGENSTEKNTRDSLSITGAEFLPGYRTRAVSAGADGKCRIVDFDVGGKLLRTWHAQGPVTSLSVLCLRTSERVSGPVNNIIAVGRQDGKVLLFDSVGLLLFQKVIDSEGFGVISVDWMRGSGPEPPQGTKVQFGEDSIIEVPSLDERLRRRSNNEKEKDTNASDSMNEKGGGILLNDVVEPQLSKDSDVEQEESCGTVNHTPIKGLVHRALPEVNAPNYIDLFSPIKQESPQKRSRRRRPRLRSSTFVDNTDGSSPQKSPSKLFVTSFSGEHRGFRFGNANKASSSKNPRNFIEREELDQPQCGIIVSRDDKKLKQAPCSRKDRRVSLKRMPGAFISSSSSLVTTDSANSSTTKILADLRRIERNAGPTKRTGLALFMPYINGPANVAQEGSCSSAKSLSLEEDPSSSNSKMQEDDIWLTSDDEMESGLRRSRRKQNELQSTKSSDDEDIVIATEIGRKSIHQDAELPPGTAESPIGPLRVKDYFPRRSSLDGKTSKALLQPSSATRDHQGDDSDSCRSEECRFLRVEVEIMRDEIAVLKAEMHELKRLVHGGHGDS